VVLLKCENVEITGVPYKHSYVL